LDKERSDAGQGASRATLSPAGVISAHKAEIINPSLITLSMTVLGLRGEMPSHPSFRSGAGLLIDRVQKYKSRWLH